MGIENAFPGVVLEVTLLCREGDHLLDLVPMLQMTGLIASLSQRFSRPSESKFKIWFFTYLFTCGILSTLSKAIYRTKRDYWT
jgi:hypothetical protein